MIQRNHLKSNIVGISSLTVFLFFIVCYVKPTFLTKHLENYITLVDPSSKPSNLFYAPRILKQFSKRHFINFNLTGNVIEDDKIMEVIRYEARKMKYTNDTTQVICIHFSNDVTYGRFVELLNMMLQDGHEHYMHYDNSFYILEFSPAIIEQHKKIEPIYL
jgi:hypothetical protein